MIDGEIYARIIYEAMPIISDAIFAYRCDAGYTGRNITHYACVVGSNVYVKNYNGSCGVLRNGPTRIATAQEIEKFVDTMRNHGFHYNKANKKVIRISTGEIL